MARIKITGYVDTDDLQPQYVDLTHEMGVSTEGYETALGGLRILSLEDVEYELERD